MPKQIPVEVAEALIFAVQRQKILYNTRLEDYRNRERTELAWGKVSEEVQRDMLWCKSTWLTLRGSFNRILSNMKMLPGGSAAQKKPKWYLFEQMLFLRPYVSHGYRNGNLEQECMPGNQYSHDSVEEEGYTSASPTENEIDEESRVGWDGRLKYEIEEAQNGNEDMMTNGSGGSPSMSPAGDADTVETHKTSCSNTKKKKIEKDNDPVQTALVRYINKCETSLQQKNSHVSVSDPEFHYFQGLFPFMKKLSDTNKLLFMSKTTHFLMELMKSEEH